MSRRAITAAIKEQTILLNWSPVEAFGTVLSPWDTIKTPLKTTVFQSAPERHTKEKIMLFHKPLWYVVSKADEHNQTVFELLPTGRAKADIRSEDWTKTVVDYLFFVIIQLVSMNSSIPRKNMKKFTRYWSNKNDQQNWRSPLDDDVLSTNSDISQKKMKVQISSDLKKSTQNARQNDQRYSLLSFSNEKNVILDVC